MRKIFGCKSDLEPFPVLHALEKMPDFFPKTEVQIVEDNELPARVFAWCFPKSGGGYVIQIKETVYQGAYENENGAFLCFICHEICHVVLFHFGYTPISTAGEKGNTIPAYCSTEWQAKALCGEVMIPYEATAGMSAKEIVRQYKVSLQSAEYRVKQGKKDAR